MDSDEEKVKAFGLSLPPGVLIQLIVMVGGIVGAWYTMKLQIQNVEADLRDFLAREHSALVSRVNTIEQRQIDVRERLGVVEQRIGDNRERLSGLEQRVFGFNRDQVDHSDERLQPGGRAFSAEQNKGK